MYDPPTSTVTANAISSPGSADGPSPCEWLGGLTIRQFGQALAPANLSARQAEALGLLTSGIYGRTGFTSSRSAGLQSSLANRLRARAASLGSTLFRLTWKERPTPLGRPICALRASTPRTSGSNCGGWPTPTAALANKGVRSIEGGIREAIRTKGADLAAVTTLTSWACQVNDQARAILPPLTGAPGPTSNGSPAATESHGQLAPTFSLWLMGYPPEWKTARRRQCRRPASSRRVHPRLPRRLVYLLGGPLVSLAAALSPNGPLAALAAWPQFILYKLAPKADRPGKMDKLPIDWRTAQVPLKGGGGAHDPAIRMDARTALLTAELYGSEYGVGFVFTDADPFWFLDIDECREGDGWSDQAVALCHQLAGCAVEVSQSNRGLHIFGTVDPATLPPHSNHPAGNLEFYRTGRFVALTGTHACGDASRSSPLLPALLTRHFPPGAAAGSADAGEWTEGPPDDYDPTLADDTELLRRMLAQTSAAGAFGNRATPRDLWTANADALDRAYPDSGQRAYDASAADAALAQHLAYWTGKDCARVDRLMRESALARPKWDERPEWLEATILRAVRLQAAYPKARPKPTPPTDGVPQPAGAVLASDMETYFAGCVYVTDRHAVLVPSGEMLRPEQFRVRYANGLFSIDSGKTTRSAWEAFAENALWKRPVVDSTCFRPKLPFGTIISEEGRSLVNTYLPIETPASPGDVTPWLRHLAKMLPVERDRAILIANMASIVQRPGVKLPWAILLQGVEGNGKSLSTIDALEHAVGLRYTHKPNAADLGNKFTGWVPGKLFVGVEEVYVRDRREVLDALKVMITGHRIEIQGKGSDQITGNNCANFFFCTNHKDAVPKTKRDRRYTVLFTAQQEEEDLERDGLTQAYFLEYRRWLLSGGYEHVTHYLRTYAIPAELDPAGLCSRAPETSSTREAIEIGRGPVEQAIIAAVEDGTPGFCGGWISSAAILALLEREKLTGRVARNKLSATLRPLGYLPHPALDRGRTDVAVAPDAVRTTLYVKEGHLSLQVADRAAVASAYTRAQPSPAAGVGFGRG